jgi:2-iminobutanoate/2-iminopropanoate deaminase
MGAMTSGDTAPARSARYLDPPEAPPHDRPYHEAVTYGDLVFVAGQVGSGPDGQVVEGFGAQTRTAIGNLTRALAAAGSSIDHLLRLNCYLTEPGHFDEFNRIYRELIPEPFPARTTIVTALVIPSLLVEIDAVAYRAG